MDRYGPKQGFTLPNDQKDRHYADSTVQKAEPMKMPRSTPTLMLLLALLMFPHYSWAWQGKVVGIQDGDSITVLHDGKGERIRLYGVDCPEGGQDFGDRAKQFTSSLTFERVVEVEPVTTDRYGRTVAKVYSGGKSVSEELIRSGFGWVFTRYCIESFCGDWRITGGASQEIQAGIMVGTESNTALGVSRAEEVETGGISKIIRSPDWATHWFSFEYCQSALSSVRMSTLAHAAILRQNSTYGHQNPKLYCVGTSSDTDHSALKSTIGYGSGWNRCRMTDAVGHETPSSIVRLSILARSHPVSKANREISRT
jgi:endonuclease YncB( thermonuclease family)